MALGLRSLLSLPCILRRLLLPLGLSWIALAPPALLAQPSQPNIIVILSDDVGYAEFGFARATSGGTSQFETPRLDALAGQSVVASQGYAAGPLCGPSRTGMLTGQYPNRTGIDDNLPNNINYQLGLTGDETLLPRRLKSLGYTTGMVGKWHLGYVDGVNRPQDLGFDEYIGFLSGSRQYFAELQPANVMRRGDVDVEAQWRTQGNPNLYDPVKGRYVTDGFGEESADFIQRHANDASPFFLYTAFTGTHTPFTAKQQDFDQFAHISDNTQRTRAAMLYAVDRGVGMIVDALNANGLMDNTIIVFANDNGGQAVVSNNLPYRDYKGKTHEGGIRVPFFIKSPELSPGVYDEAVSLLDVAPTLVAAAGGAVPASQTDGVDLTPYLSGANPGSPHDVMHWRATTFWAVRKGDWKLARPHENVPATAAFRGLYNLANDPTESVNLINQQPAIAADLYRELTFWEATLEKPKFGPLGAARNQFDHFVFNGVAGATTQWNAANAWSNAATSVAASMFIDDAYANAILEFPVLQSGNYTANNNMTRMSGETFMLNEMRLTGVLTSASNRSATITGNALLFVRSLSGQNPRIRLDATAGAGAGTYTVNLNEEIQLLHNLDFFGNGTQTFVVNGAIRDYYEPRSVTKAGTSTLMLAGNNTYRGGTVVLGGELRLASAGAALDGTSYVAVGTGGKLSMSAGLIRTERMAIAPQGQFQFTGGTLQTAEVQGNLTNAGGVFAGGTAVGTVDILGNFVQTSGTLQLDLGTSPQGPLFDRLAVTGSVQLGGVLDVDLFNSQGGSFTPSAGSTYEIIAAGGGVTGSFAQTLLPALPGSLVWQLSIGPSNVLLKVLSPSGTPPPFNSAGLAIWRQNYGLASGALPSQGDWNADGDVDGADFLTWQRNLGSAQPVTQSIPEPASAALLIAASLTCMGGVRRWRR